MRYVSENTMRSKVSKCTEPAGKFKCCECGYPIFEDEKYFDSENGAICEECLGEKTAKEIIELCGETLTVA